MLQPDSVAPAPSFVTLRWLARRRSPPLEAITRLPLSRSAMKFASPATAPVPGVPAFLLLFHVAKNPARLFPTSPAVGPKPSPSRYPVESVNSELAGMTDPVRQQTSAESCNSRPTREQAGHRPTKESSHRGESSPQTAKAVARTLPERRSANDTVDQIIDRSPRENLSPSWCRSPVQEP
jgi:hypothetical protein